MDSDAADISETDLSDALLSELQHVCDEIQSAYSGKRAIIRKIGSRPLADASCCASRNGS